MPYNSELGAALIKFSVTIFLETKHDFARAKVLATDFVRVIVLVNGKDLQL